MNVLTVLQYGILLSRSRANWIMIERVPQIEGADLWAIRCGGIVMSNKTGRFCMEPMPSSRTKAFIKRYRFKSAEEAYACYRQFHGTEQDIFQDWNKVYGEAEA